MYSITRDSSQKLVRASSSIDDHGSIADRHRAHRGGRSQRDAPRRRDELVERRTDDAPAVAILAALDVLDKCRERRHLASARARAAVELAGAAVDLDGRMACAAEVLVEMVEREELPRTQRAWTRQRRQAGYDAQM